MRSGGSILRLCVRVRAGLWMWKCIYQPCCRLQCVTVKREPGPGGRPTGIKKALSVGCVSQWAAEPRGAALLIKAGAVCQRRHMMHSAITVGGKTKRKARLLQPLQQICCLTMEAKTSYYSNDCCGCECQYQFAMCYPTSNQSLHL